MSLNRREALALIALSTVDLDLSTSWALRGASSPGLPLPPGSVIALETRSLRFFPSFGCHWN
jgi:hypothetical protein